MTYQQIKPEELTLRDCLARDRTILANERTFLAFTRTGLMFVVTGVTVYKLMYDDGLLIVIMALLFCVLGLSILIYGTVRYNKVRRQLSKIG